MGISRKKGHTSFLVISANGGGVAFGYLYFDVKHSDLLTANITICIDSKNRTRTEDMAKAPLSGE